MDKEFFAYARDCFDRYTEYKRPIDDKIIEDNRWFYDQMRFSDSDDRIRPSTAFVFNAVANKHADAMDNFPEVNILARTKKDEAEAKALAEIVPLQLEISGFKNVYCRNWWHKLKNGAAVYGVFFDNKAAGGIGDIKITAVDILNIFWEPYINDIQQSEFVFCADFINTNALRRMYPKKKITPYADESKIRKQLYRRWGDEQTDKSLVVDCYYKNEDGVQLIKFCGDTVLDSTQDRGMKYLYAHGKYPFVIDTLYPGEDTIVGLSLIDVMKNPQEYINRLDAIISKNAFISGKVRFMVRDNGGINEYELTDLSSDIIHVAGSVDESNIRQFQAAPLDAFIVNHRQNKISEIKEVAGNRDFQQGGTSNGVTAASAISTLQQSGEKLSRDMIYQSYESYKEIVYMCIELIREFFTEPHFYRALSPDGSYRYITYTAGEKRCEFDIEVGVQKSSPGGRLEQNNLARELYAMGVFDKGNEQKAQVLVELMQFDGKERVMDYLRRASESGAALRGGEVRGGEGGDGQGGAALASGEALLRE